VILAAFQPSLTDLARDSGRDRRTVMRYLSRLERDGWVIRKRPPIALARKEHLRTQYAIGIPQARDTTPPGLEAAEPGPRGLMPRELGTPGPEAGGTTPRRSSVSSRSSEEDLNAIIEIIRERDGIAVGPEWAARVLEQITGARGIRNPAAYARRVIKGAPPGTYAPHQGPPPFTREKGFT